MQAGFHRRGRGAGLYSGLAVLIGFQLGAEDLVRLVVVGALDVLDEHLARLHVHQFQAGEFNARGVVHGKLHPLVGLPSLNGGGGDDVRPVGAVFVLIIGPLPAVADLLIGVVLVLGVGVGNAHQGVPAVTVHRHRVVVQVRGEQGHL